MPSSPSLSDRLIRSGYKEFQDRDAELTIVKAQVIDLGFYYGGWNQGTNFYLFEIVKNDTIA